MKKRVLISLGLFCTAALLMCACSDQKDKPEQSSKASVKTSVSTSFSSQDRSVSDNSGSAEKSGKPEEKSLVSKKEISDDIEPPEEKESEVFTEKELADMENVGKRLEELTGSPEYASMTDDQKIAAGKKLLEKLGDEGLIIKNSISVSDDMISFSYSCGVLGGMKVRGFDPMMN